MDLASREMLRRLGAGQSIDAVCQAAGITRTQFDAWWQAETAARVPPAEGSRRVAVRGDVEIVRDAWGIPHIHAGNDPDLFFGFGYAMAQDRLFQLDYLRRKGAGRLCEILGRTALEQDLLVRTVGVRRIAEDELTRLPPETRAALDAFAAGVNAQVADWGERLPIEFDMLDYRPEPWTPVDSLTVEGEFRWYLTGRMWVIAMPELAKRTLADWSLYRLFLSRESDRESMLPPGSYPRSRCGVQATGPVMGLSRAQPASAGARACAGAPDAGEHTADAASGQAQGSNNWVVAGSRCATGKPLLASDPHIAFEAVSCWYEVHLRGGSYNVAGMAYVGMPAVMFGRTEGAAWGCTNNICSQRDLYQEKTDPAHPGCFLYDGCWEPGREIEEVIGVRGEGPVRQVIRLSRNGPIVDAVLPRAARETGPVSLRWLGASEGGWLTALLAMDRAQSAAALREAMRTWHVPTFSVVCADTAGHIGYQATGRVPIRNVPERAYRPGWDPLHQWDGLIPFDGMPFCVDPPRGWLATANHRPAPDDFPYPLSGTWLDDLRARRIRERIEAAGPLTRDEFAAMQLDCKSLRAVECLPKLLAILRGVADDRMTQAMRLLEPWDCELLPDSSAAAIFEAFFAKWLETVTAARFSGAAAELLVMAIAGAATALLDDDPHGWFPRGTRVEQIERAFRAGLEWLTERLGPDMSQWAWGRLHTMPLRHWLSSRGELGRLLDHAGVPVRGDSTAVCNTGLANDLTAPAGCGYRLIADLSSSPAGLWAVDAQSQSGNPGSPHYGDQLADWMAGRYHYMSLTEDGMSGGLKFLLVPSCP